MLLSLQFDVFNIYFCVKYFMEQNTCQLLV